MTDQEFNVIRQLRDKGYAVVSWNPQELRGVDPSHVEDIMIERAYDLIDSMATEPDPAFTEDEA